MTGRVYLTPEAERQLHQIDDWIAEHATADLARDFVSAILGHIEGIVAFPFAGRARDDIRPGMRTTTFRKRTLVVYEIAQSSPGLTTINVLGVFHGGQDWEAALSEESDDPGVDE